MAKRFIATETFRTPLIRRLEAPYKLLWLYLICDCDHAGIWEVELDVAGLRLGQEYDEHRVIEEFGDAVIPIDNGTKWFLPDFVDFQYGKLDATNRVHKSVIAIFSKHGLLTHPKIKPLFSPSQGAKDKDKDQEKKKDKNQDRKKAEKYPLKFLEFWAVYPRKVGKDAALNAWAKREKLKDLPANEVILNAVELQSHSQAWMKDGGQFIPNPSTWIMQGRWNDEVQQANDKGYYSEEAI